MKKYIILSSMFLSFFYSKAQTTWTLQQCIDYAAEHNIEIKQQSLAVQNAELDLNTAQNSRLPNLNASVNYGFNFGQTTSNSTNMVSASNSSSASLSVNSSVPLFTGFRITNQIKAGKIDLLAATEGLNKARHNLSLQIMSYYLEILFKKEIVKVHSEQADLTAKQVQRTQILVEAGKVALSQEYDIKAQLAREELNVTNAKNDLSLSLLNLVQVLNLTDFDDFDILEPKLDNLIESSISSLMPVEEVYKSALETVPDVQEAKYKVESSLVNLNLSKSGYYPSLNLNLSYSNSAQRYYNIDNLSFKDQISNYGREYVGFSLNIPIFNRFEVRNKVRAARLNIQNNELMLDNVKLKLYKDIQLAYRNAVAAQAKFNATDKALKAATESYKYAVERYQIGKSTVYEYSDAMNKLASSKSEQIQAKYDFYFRSKILDFHAGKPIVIP